MKAQQNERNISNQNWNYSIYSMIEHELDKNGMKMNPIQKLDFIFSYQNLGQPLWLNFFQCTIMLVNDKNLLNFNKGI